MSADPSDEKTLILFGRDISKMPCFRNSYLYGISGGIGTGLLYFLFTSRTKAAADVGMASFAVITLSYWVHCRYHYSKNKFEMKRLQEMMRQRTLYEGTDKINENVLEDNRPVEV